MTFLNKIFYGWWITLVLFIAGLLAFGGGVYAFTLFLPSLETEFGWGRAVTGGAVSVLWLSAPLLPLIGHLVDRFGARLLVGTGLLITGVLYMLMFFVQAAWQLYAIRMIMGIGKLLVLVSIYNKRCPLVSRPPGGCNRRDAGRDPPGRVFTGAGHPIFHRHGGMALHGAYAGYHGAGCGPSTGNMDDALEQTAGTGIASGWGQRHGTIRISIE